VIHTSPFSNVRDRPTVEQFLLFSADEEPIRSAAHRCPGCGRVELHDSTISGTCMVCPGLVELVAV
jgi:hypothetical protein